VISATAVHFAFGPPVAQRKQMHARPRSLAGTAASASASNFTAVHQQGVSKLPLPAGAQSLGKPQSGQ
jgi:hypothetical protein